MAEATDRDELTRRMALVLRRTSELTDQLIEANRDAQQCFAEIHDLLTKESDDADQA